MQRHQRQLNGLNKIPVKCKGRRVFRPKTSEGQVQTKVKIATVLYCRPKKSVSVCRGQFRRPAWHPFGWKPMERSRPYIALPSFSSLPAVINHKAGMRLSVLLFMIHVSLLCRDIRGHLGKGWHHADQGDDGTFRYFIGTAMWLNMFSVDSELQTDVDASTTGLPEDKGREVEWWPQVLALSWIQEGKLSSHA